MLKRSRMNSKNIISALNEHNFIIILLLFHGMLKQILKTLVYTYSQTSPFSEHLIVERVKVYFYACQLLFKTLNKGKTTIYLCDAKFKYILVILKYSDKIFIKKRLFQFSIKTCQTVESLINKFKWLINWIIKICSHLEVFVKEILRALLLSSIISLILGYGIDFYKVYMYILFTETSEL